MNERSTSPGVVRWEDLDLADGVVRNRIFADVAERLEATHLAVGTAVLRSVVDATLDALRGGAA